jgi:hypothetical protein
MLENLDDEQRKIVQPIPPRLAPDSSYGYGKLHRAG